MRFRDVETFRKGPGVLAAGKIGYLPREAEIENLHLESEALQSPGTCRVGKCNVKLSSGMMDRCGTFRMGGTERLAWTMLPRLLFNYPRRYQEDGTEAMIAYGDWLPRTGGMGRWFMRIVVAFSHAFRRVQLTVPLDLRHGAKDVLAVVRRAWPRSRSRSAYVVGAGRHDTNFRPELVVRVSHRLVLALATGESAFLQSASTA